MDSQKVVTPVKTGVQGFPKLGKFLDSDFRRNDNKKLSATISESILKNLNLERRGCVFAANRRTGQAEWVC